MKLITDHRTLSRIYIETKTELKNTKESLDKLLGCSKGNFSNFLPKYNESLPISSQKLPQKRSIKELENSTDSAEEYINEDEFPSGKVTLRSAVISQVKGIKTRREAINKQNYNTKIQSRNRRILGMMQNTLQKFQVEAVKRKSQDIKRMKVEKKVEAAVEEEKKTVEKQKLELYSKQQEKQLELECLKEMMELTELYDVWKSNHKHLLNYNITEAEPKICFLPVSHTSSTKEHFKNSNVKIEEALLMTCNQYFREFSGRRGDISEVLGRFNFNIDLICDFFTSVGCSSINFQSTSTSF